MSITKQYQIIQYTVFKESLNIDLKFCLIISSLSVSLHQNSVDSVTLTRSAIPYSAAYKTVGILNHIFYIDILVVIYKL